MNPPRPADAPPLPPLPFERRIVKRELDLRDSWAEVLYLECGHEAICVVPYRGDTLPCSECLHDWMEQQKAEKKGGGDVSV